MNSKAIECLKNQRGQNILELVVGLGLIAVVAVAISVMTVNSLRNSQFSKNQNQATKLAQELIEKVRTVKESNFGLCTQAQVAAGSSCSTWEEIWGNQFGTIAANCITNQSCTYVVGGTCNTSYTGVAESKPFCLRHSATALDLGDGFTGQVFIEDEQANQKRVTVRVSWTDSSGTHTSELITVLSRI